MNSTHSTSDSERPRGGALRIGLTLGVPAALLAALFFVHSETAWLVLAANLFGLIVAWFVTRFCGLPRDGSLRSERQQVPRVAGRITPETQRQ